uniref:Tyr recombinase domain-containing protein n=1 Tax=Xenopus tropicalis TaxID=8364 RepID=A0A6I8RND0_XENTR
MAIHNHRQMGPPTRFFGLQDPIPSQAPLQVSGIKHPSYSPKETCPQASHRHHVTFQGNHTSPSTRKENRFLLKSLSGPKKGRVFQTSARPEGFKQIPVRTVIQNGVAPFRHSQRPVRRFLHINRPPRRLPTHSHSPGPPEISTLCIRREPLPVPSPPIRPGYGPSGVYEGDGSLGGLHATTRTIRPPLPRRPLATSSISLSITDRNQRMCPHPRNTRVANTPQKKYIAPYAIHCLSRRPLRFQSTQGFSPDRKTETPQVSGATSHHVKVPYRKILHAASGTDDLNHRGSSVRPISYATTSTRLSQTMVKTSSRPQKPNIPVLPRKTLLTMVAPTQQTSKGQNLLFRQLVRSHNRRQLTRLGRCLRTQDNTRKMVPTRSKAPYQSTRNPGSIPIHHSLGTPPTWAPSKNSVRQRHHRGVHQPPGGHEEPRLLEGSIPTTSMGRGQPVPSCSSVHPRPPQLGSGLPQPELRRPRGMVSTQGCVPTAHTPLGNTTGGPHGLPVQSPGPSLLHQIPRPSGICGRCNDHPLEFRPSIHLSPHTHDSPNPPQTPPVPDDSHSSHSVLATKVMVLRPTSTSNNTTLEAPSETGPPIPRENTPPWAGKPGTHGMAIESAIWARKGFSTKVTTTLMKARKPVTVASYHRIWNTFLTWCTETQHNTSSCHIPTLLDFLQEGLDKGLGVNSLKVQVSALSLPFQRQLAIHPDVKTFIQAATHIKPPYKDPIPPWDLNLVLHALQNKPFEPLATIDLKLLTWKVAFLVAISSARRISELGALSHKTPYCIFHEDKVVLRTLPTFLPKVTSAFHLNQEIVLPSLCPKPSSPQERRLHNLDVVRALKFYINRTTDFRRSDSLFVLYGPKRKGAKASKASIARWIKSLITSTYQNKGLPIPFKTSAHTTRALSTSWALANAASAEQLCKAATWSSIHTFTKFYKFHVFSSAEASFSRKVLQSAVRS